MDYEFPEHAEDNRRIWEANALWWDDRIGDGNDFQTMLIEPATERLLQVTPGDLILDVACGAGRFARRMAELGAQVVAFDQSNSFIERARERTPQGAAVEYHNINAASSDKVLSLGLHRFDKAVCTMALMDMPEITPLLSSLKQVLKPGGIFVFSVAHPCFNSFSVQRFAELGETADGRSQIRTGVRVFAYRTPVARKGEGIIGQPEPQYDFHRPLYLLLGACFAAGFCMDGIEEPGFPVSVEATPEIRWVSMPEIPPVLVVRMRLTNGG
jgi:SAM-dependent methyltransferase